MQKAVQFLVFLLVVTGLAWWYYQYTAVQKTRHKTEHAVREAANEERFKNWAYVAIEKEIAPGETIKLVVIPDPTGFDFLDTKCLIYTHREFKTSSIVCPDADRDNIKERIE